jgi:hypothetical protein
MSSSTTINGPLQNRDLFERLSGSIERITFHSEATGFCVRSRLKATATL